MNQSETTSNEHGAQPKESEHYAGQELEQIFIGALIEADPAALAELKGIARTDFTSLDRAEIAEVVRLHAESGWPVEPVAVNATLIDRGWPHVTCEIAECLDAFLAPIHSAKISFYANRLRVRSKLRALQRELGSSWAALGDASLDIDERLRLVERVPPALVAAQEALGAARESSK